MAAQTTPESVTTEGEELDHIIKLAEPVVAPGNSDLPSNSIPTSSITSDAMNNPQCEGPSSSSIKNEVDPKQVGEHGISTPATNGYNYCYPGYTGTCTQLDENDYLSADGSQVGTQSENGSRFYHLPGYNPYPLGGVDRQCTGQLSYLPSSGYVQHPVSYGSEAAVCYSWNSTYVAGVAHGNTGSGYEKYGAKSTGFAKSNGKHDNKFSNWSYTQHTRSQSKASQLRSDFSAGRLKGDDHVGKVSAFTGKKQGAFLHNGAVNFTQNGRVWNGDYRDKSRDGFKGSSYFDTTMELICGPRALNKNDASDSPAKKKDSAFAGRREQYNRPDFELEHPNAKFYVIKSYSEDDIHKSIKYDVWASTPNGNKKLDAAFHKAQEISTESGAKCPIFLFFSVNGSGQFVGLAEMVGQVDFNKDMDFWQLDKWNGFFPVRWHVVKDIPNAKLRHIVLENNEGKPVTFTRDTQEVGLKQGLEMLTIFKSYSAETSLLDDLAFYENRDKSLAKKANKLATLQMEISEDRNGEFFSLFAQNPATRMVEGRCEDKSRTRTIKTGKPSSVISQTKNLSLNDYNNNSKQHTSLKKSIRRPIPSLPAP